MDCGLSGVALATSDAHRGLTEAIGTTVPGAAWRRCRTHYAANLMSVTPKSAWGGSARCCTASMTQPGAASHHTAGRDLAAETLRHRDGHGGELVAQSWNDK